MLGLNLIHVRKGPAGVGIPITSVASPWLRLNCRRNPGPYWLFADLVITSTLGWEIYIIKLMIFLNDGTYSIWTANWVVFISVGSLLFSFVLINLKQKQVTTYIHIYIHYMANSLAYEQINLMNIRKGKRAVKSRNMFTINFISQILCSYTKSFTFPTYA